MDAASDRDPLDRMVPSGGPDKWPPNPVRAEGVLKVSLLGLELAQVRLDLTIRAASWIIDRVGDALDLLDDPQADDLDALSRRELLARAAEIEIIGRSRMTKSDLIRSLRT